jgi:hypothetical protein
MFSAVARADHCKCDERTATMKFKRPKPALHMQPTVKIA